MPTPHIAAQPGEIAKTVLMPGDPLRAKFIAESYLENPRLINEVRGMLGYTGLWQGKEITVMGSGMGMPSMGIYSYELFTQYDVENILRVGSAGSYSEQLAVLDILLVTGAWSESSFARTQNGYAKDMTYPSASLNEAIRASARQRKKSLSEGVVHSTDVFYCEPEEGTPYWQTLREEKGCLAVEMESFSLFHNAFVTGKQAACLLTISDSFLTAHKLSPEQREKSFTDMMEIALYAV